MGARGSPRFTAAFTEHFRGSTDEVSAELEGYLPDLHRLAGLGGVADLGCGRGERLALLRSARVAARGVDPNSACVAAGRAPGLDMRLGDALATWRLSPDSADMVTAFHVIGHLPTEDLVELLQAALRALHPVGCLLLETPDATNLILAAGDCYNDPTHRSPLPSAQEERLRWFLEPPEHRPAVASDLQPLRPGSTRLQSWRRSLPCCWTWRSAALKDVRVSARARPRRCERRDPHVTVERGRSPSR